MKYYFTLFLLIIIFSFSVQAETIWVKYRNTPIDTPKGDFEELKIKHSSFVKRILFDEQNSYLLVKLSDTFYHYCGISKSEVQKWQSAQSLGKYYNTSIKGKYDCRLFSVPRYP